MDTGQGMSIIFKWNTEAERGVTCGPNSESFTCPDG